MKPACKTYIYINIPCLSGTIKADISFSEKVSDLIERVLRDFGIKEHTNFKLFGKTMNFQVIPSQYNCCALFASSYDSFVLQSIDYVPVKVYYENNVTKIDYNPKAPLSDLISIAVSCLSIDIKTSYYLAIDAKTNNICPYDSPITGVNSIILMPLNLFLSGILFSPNEFPTQKENTFMALQCLSSCFFSKQFSNVLSILNSRSQSTFHFQKLTSKRTKEIFSLFMEGKDLWQIPSGELNSFTFMLLSSSEKPLISDRLHSLSIEAIQRKTDIERIEFISVIVSCMPVATYFILLELSLIYGGIQSNETTRRRVICLVSNLLFPKTINRGNEIKFVSYLFMFYFIIFSMPQKTSHILRIKDGNIYLAQKNSKGKYEIYSPNGPENIKYNDTNDYVIHFNVTDIIDKYCYNEDNDNDEETEDITEDFEAFNQKLTFLTKLFNEFKDVETRTSLFARRKTDSFVSSSAYQEKRLRLKKYRTEKPQNCEMSTRCHSQVLFQININDSVKATQEKNKMYDFKIDENNNLKPTELKRRKPPIMGQRRRSTKGKHSEKIKANENVNESILNEKHSDDINGSILNEKQSDVLNKDNGDEDTKVNELEQKENIPNEKQSDGNEQENENIEEKHSGEENEKTQINELEQKENEILNEEHSDENEKEDNINTEENEKTEINEFEQNENEILNEEHSDGNEENVTNTENKEENDKIEINELEHNESDNQISDENDAKRSDNGTQESSTENKEENKSDNANEEDIDSDSSIVEVRLIEYSSGDESGSSSSSSSSDMEVEEEDEEF